MFAKDDQMGTFIKLILVFALLMVVTIMGLGLYLFTHSQTLIAKETSKDSLYRLERMRDYLETSTLKRYEEVFQDKIVSTAYRKNDGLGYLLNDRSGHLGSKFLDLHNELRNTVLTQSGLSNMAVHFVDSGFTVDANYIYEKVDHFNDAAFISQLDSSVMQRWMKREDGAGNEVLTYVQALPFGATLQQARGYFYVDVSLNYVSSLLDEMRGSPEESFYIVGSDGQLLLSGAQGMEIEAGTADWLAGSSAMVQLMEEGEQTAVWAYSPAALSSNGWGFAVARPLDSLLLESKKFRQHLVVASLIAGLIAIIISLFASRRFYVPLKRIAVKIQSLNHSLEKARLLKLIHGDVGEGGVDRYGEGGVDRYGEGANLATVYIRIRSGELTPAMLGATWNGKPFRWEVASISQEELAVLLIMDEQEENPEERTRRALQLLQANLRGHCAFGAGFGSIARMPQDVAESYREAKSAARYCFLFGGEAIIGVHDIAGRGGAIANMNFERFESSIHAADMEAVEQYLEGFEGLLIERDYSIETAEWAFMQLTVCLHHMVLHYKLADRMEIPDLQQMLRGGTLHEGLQQVAGSCRQITTFLNHTAHHMHAETISAIQEYIDKHLDEDIYLDLVAEYVSFSPSYISKLFVEVLNMPFIEYLNRTRLEAAARLLREGNESVTNIARKVGYGNVQYFCTKFKAKYNLTPNQYRKTAWAKVEAEAT